LEVSVVQWKASGAVFFSMIVVVIVGWILEGGLVKVLTSPKDPSMAAWGLAVRLVMVQS
jgi:hypothetical protein